eukprot:11344746-Alexandrium_andersonii.AAC.1
MHGAHNCGVSAPEHMKRRPHHVSATAKHWRLASEIATAPRNCLGLPHALCYLSRICRLRAQHFH